MEQLQKKEYSLVCYLALSDIPSRLDMLPNLQNYAYILHDKDYDKNGNIIEPHIHVYLKFVKKININVVAEKFGLTPNNVYVVYNEMGALRYLVHRNHLEKYQYSPSEVFTDILDYKLLLDNFDQDKYLWDTFFNMLESDYILLDITKFYISNKYIKWIRSNYFMINCLYNDYHKNTK